ncbi:HAD domain-containing protein [Burkholderia stagnalis]|uniref:HAD domain-containing protein n=1 Tax=Burkholderia stagnalis TaxID=1503054 RepID=UPI000A6F6DB5|nr:HAD domain-containing protein [Burkholderia stagnalis]
MRQVLFLDYDGVLHRGDTYVTPHGVVSSAPNTIELFEFAPALLELLAPHPQIEIVLSTDWCFRFGLERARDSLPLGGLRQRVTGATYEAAFEDSTLWPSHQRGVQILRYVRRHNILSWLAADDRRDGFQGYYDQLVHCQTESGLGDRAVIELFRSRLAERFGETPLSC